MVTKWTLGSDLALGETQVVQVMGVASFSHCRLQSNVGVKPVMRVR